MCPRSGRRSVPSLRPGSRTSGDASGRFSGGTSEKPKAPCDPIERGAVGEARVPGLLRTCSREGTACQRIARRLHLLLRPPAEGRARCVSALPKRRSAPFPQPLTSRFLYPSSRGLTAGPGHARSRAPRSHFCVPTGTQEAWREEAFLRSPVFSLAILSPARPQPSRQAQGSQNLEMARTSFSEALNLFFGLRAFLSSEIHIRCPRLSPRD